MYRHAARTILRSSQSSLPPARTLPSCRFISTAPPRLRSRGWKSSALRWGVAIAGIYYYNTSSVFAEQPQNNLLNPNLEAIEDEDSPSLDILASRRRKPSKNAQTLQSAADTLSSENASTSVSNQSITADASPTPDSPAELEEEAESEGAFNPETGEINWDCACLGGMAHGPCGPEFREAFSCFVFSKEEPKGMDCIDKFQGMRDCFQQHPEVYKDELMDDEEIDRELENERQDLAQQIKERRENDLAGEEGSQRRLLEEAPPAPRASRSDGHSETTLSMKESATKLPPVPPNKESAATPATKEEKQGKNIKSALAPEEKENINEGQKSSILRKPSPPPVQEAADPVDELIPKAAHDAH